MMARLRRIWEKNWPEVHCAIRGGLPDFLLSRNPPSSNEGVPAFCYHIPDAQSFESDLVHLQNNGYRTMDAELLLHHLTGTCPAPPRSVVLTFDDGPVDLYRIAYPLLREYGFKAVAFIAPYFHDYVTSKVPHGRSCTWDEMGEMQESGVVDFQSHTYEHRLLWRWPEPAPICGVVNGINIAAPNTSRTFSEDFELAKRTIETRLGKEVCHLCFPCYTGTAAAISAAESVGYRGFWWGTLPGVPVNRPAPEAARRIVRVSEEFLRRLPGEGRVPLRTILTARYLRSLKRMRGNLRPDSASI